VGEAEWLKLKMIYRGQPFLKPSYRGFRCSGFLRLFTHCEKKLLTPKVIFNLVAALHGRGLSPSEEMKTEVN